MDSSAFRTGRRFSNINSDSPISPRDASQFHLRCRWHQSVGDLPRGEEQAWPEVRHPLPDYGLRLRYTNSHHDADCWLHHACCGFPPVHWLIVLSMGFFFSFESSPEAVSIFIFISFSLCLFWQGSRRGSFSCSRVCLPQCWPRYGEWHTRTITVSARTCFFFPNLPKLFVLNSSHAPLCLSGHWLTWTRMERWTGWSFLLPWSS